MGKNFEKKYNGGVEASRKRSKTHSKKEREFSENRTITYVKYRDHILFRNCDSSEMKPCIREVVGWVTRENSEALCICSDMPIEPFLHEKPKESGVIILKSDIIETHELESDKAFK